VPAADRRVLVEGGSASLLDQHYNALVLQTVINDYPSGNRSTAFPANSVGRFPARSAHHASVGGQTLTLDDLETKVIGAFRRTRDSCSPWAAAAALGEPAPEKRGLIAPRNSRPSWPTP
jgi:hypothetical protein